MNKYYVYILASQRNGTLYTGLTDDLKRRVLEHKQKLEKGFTAKYNVGILVYFEEFENANEAALREKRIKKWKRAWKLELIEKNNPNWNDLAEGWF
jgi:putative endonuclease